MDKAHRILRLYHRLLLGKHVSRHEQILECDISSRTLDRDIADIKAFLHNEATGKGIAYDAANDTYVLIIGDETRLSQQTLDVASCFLLCELLRWDTTIMASEREHLVYELLSWLPGDDRKFMWSWLQRAGVVFHEKYIHSIAIKLIDDLLRCIKDGKAITLHFREDQKDELCIPYTMFLKQKEAILVAWAVEESRPTNYNMLQIDNFNVEIECAARYDPIKMERYVKRMKDIT